MSDMDEGSMNAPREPRATCSATSASIDGANGQAAETSPYAKDALTSVLFAPMRSETLPEAMSKAAKGSVYPLIAHCRTTMPPPRSAAMEGSAMFATKTDMQTISMDSEAAYEALAPAPSGAAARRAPACAGLITRAP